MQTFSFFILFLFFHFTSYGQHEISPFSLLVCFNVLKLLDVLMIYEINHI